MESAVTGPDLAKLLGLDVRSISDLARAGHVVRISKGRYDLAASVPRYCQHLRDLAQGRFGGTADVASGTAARARLAQAQQSWPRRRRAPCKAACLTPRLLSANGRPSCPACVRGCWPCRRALRNGYRI
jgi:phage terminase Nu1 subunit (DNA packaging protein)